MSVWGKDSFQCFHWGGKKGSMIQPLIIIGSKSCTDLKDWNNALSVLLLIASYRNSYKKNICVDMLRDGYHKSFTELFALMEKWDAQREAARLSSLLWVQRPLEEQPDKLDHFYHYLTRAEAAERKGKWRGLGKRCRRSQNSESLREGSKWFHVWV